MGVNGIYGLSGSGLDVESMVKVGMLSKQSEYDKMQQKYTKNEWKKTEYLNVYGELQTFNSSTLSQYKLSSNMNARSASSANSSVVSATANASAALMTHYVNVSSLASNVYLIGTKLDRENETASVKNQLQSILFDTISKSGDNVIADGVTYNSTDTAISFSINDGINGLLASTDSNAVTASASPDATTGDTGKYTISVTQLAEPPQTLGASVATALGVAVTPSSVLSDTLDTVASNNNLNMTIGTYLSNLNVADTTTALEFKIKDGTTDSNGNENYSKITYTYADLKDLMDGTKTFQDFINNLNEKIQAGGASNVTASISEDGTLSLSNSETGASSKVAISIDSATALAALNNFRTLTSGGTVNPYAIEGTQFDAVAAGVVFSMLMGGTSSSHLSDLMSAGSLSISDGVVNFALAGTNAAVTITDSSGNSTSLTPESNTFTYNNVTYTIKETTTTSNPNGVTISNTGDQNIKITYGDLANGFTLNELASKINSQNTNIRATYDSVQDRFSIYNKESGEENQLNISLASNKKAENLDGDDTNDIAVDVGNNTEKLFDAFGFKQSSAGTLISDVIDFTKGETTSLAGTNGSVKIDGVEYDIDSNKTTVNGVTYTFLNETSGNVAVNVTQDTEGIVERVKSFVSDYNALMTKLYKWYDEKPNTDYKPLTASQKESMKEEQIEKWEEKAKAGLLYHDTTLGKIITELRSTISENVDGINSKYNNIFSVGISTTGLKGQLKLDEDKLNAALAEDPDAVYNIFAKLDSGEKQYKLEKLDVDGTTRTGKYIWSTKSSLDGYAAVLDDDGNQVTKTVERTSYNGVAQRLGDIFMTSMKNVKSVSGSTADITEDSELNNLLRELQTKMSNFKKMMQAFETQLYKKYDAMESSLALLGAQLNYVTGAFSQ